MQLESLPTPVAEMLARLAAPPRLVAHLRLVHDLACQLIERLDAAWPALIYDRAAVRFGAATHDIGKILHPNELAGPGHQHEASGEALLLAQGVSASDARFARTHGMRGEQIVILDDALVALADSWWRGRRDEALETTICQLIAMQTHTPQWRIFLTLDEIATDLTAEADARLRWQNQHTI
ncbi:MAG: phosphohydrolase [Ktedonobacterales bacterium]